MDENRIETQVGQKGKKLPTVLQVILRILQEHPEGIDIKEIRKLAASDLDASDGQEHLNRRLRDLDPMFVIDRKRQGKKTLYLYKGERPDGEYDFAVISKKLRAKILTRDASRCRMCGKTVAEDQIKLHIDHKIPRNWGGLTVEENLWALCSACNEGKKNYFASFDANLMEKILDHESVHRRLVEMLRGKMGEWVDCDLLEFVANFKDYQTEWRKRLRELRYFGLEIATKNQKVGQRTLSLYKLNNWVELPADLTEAARQFEVKRAKKNRAKESDNV